MITIQTAMYVALGFLIASFLAVLVVPAYRARTVRLTSARIRASLPTTEEELRADKDRIRADSALRIHRLESELEQMRFDAARRLIEVGRRDGEINTLGGQIDALRSEVEEASNARSVLEQTVADRLPKVEQRLIEAKKLLFQRDREIAQLTQESERTQQALVEAVQINSQQRSEIDRLTMVLETRGAQNRGGLADPAFDAEVALRSEIESLRTRSRDQAALIDRLQAGGEHETPSTAAEPAEADIPEVVRLQRDLVRAESALKAMKDAASAGNADVSRHAVELRSRDQRLEDQAQEIARLQAALATYEADPAKDGERGGLSSIKDSKIAMKSRLSALKVQTDAQAETIRKLRAEVAASNERLARQAQHFMEEMRRLGAGTLPTTAQLRKPPSSVARRTLAEKISEAKPDLVVAVNGTTRPVLVKADPKLAVTEPRAVTAEPEAPPAAPPAADSDGTGSVAAPPVAEGGASNGNTDGPAGPMAPPPPAAARPRLVDRIAEYSKR